MVEVFRTNVQSSHVAQDIIANLLQYYPTAKINFDLEDCDKILRIESQHIVLENVIELLTSNGYTCEVLD
ncbi:MAG TPA: hypothetical protein PLJ60_21400 [Chryseolinea sp.]|nr:hypothetical protein [Chryseolinea sp.]HPM32904.1 hypothetical protein [Chryseolinea sp.]